MQKSLLLCGTAIVAFALTACDEEYGYYDDRPGYYDDHPGYYTEASGPSVDFYYVESRPYSRSYGPLYLRGGNYYYSRGGSYVVYDRPTRVYRNTNYRVVNRDVNVRNVRYNNERVVRDERYRDRNVVGERYRRDYPERRVETRQQQYTRQAPTTAPPQTVRVRSHQRVDGRQVTVEESNQRKVKSSQRKNQRKQSELSI